MNGLLLESPPRMLPRQGAVAWSYREQQVQGASPLQAILLVYDFALGACARKDLPRALEALSTLRGALDFVQGGDIACRLQSLYLYCEEQVRQRQYDACERILRELRAAWAQSATTPAARAVGPVEVTA
jgi:flagellar secretion chaperone FliS